MKRRLVSKVEGRWTWLLSVIWVLEICVGCGKVPTWNELTGQQQPQGQTTPVVVQPAPVQPSITPVAPPKPNAAEVIAKFKQLKPYMVSDVLIAELASLTEGLEEVTEVLATASSVTDSGLVNLSKFPNLKTLELDSTKVTDQGMQHVAQAPSLESVSLSNTVVSDAGMAALATLPNLKKLVLMKCPLSPEGYASIGRMPVLEEIVLDNTGGINDQTFDSICDARTLKRLQMNYVGGITDNGMRSLAKLDILEEFSVNDCPVTGEAFGYVAKTGLKNIKKIFMNRCPITLAGAKSINMCKSLEHLNVGNVAMDDKGFVILIQGLKNLKYLHLNGCKQLTGSGFTALKSADNLEVLTLVETGVVDQAMLLLKGHKNLKRLELSNTNVSMAAIDALKKLLPGCEIIR